MRLPQLFFVGLAFAAMLRATEPAGSQRVRVILVGDSTVSDKSGWGPGFKAFVDDAKVECINAAANGRSSMSFIKEERWKQALELRGDYYLIQFGHNDEPGKPGRSTTEAEYRQYMQRYVDEARAIGAKPILVTSLVRRQFDAHDPHKINSSLRPRVAIVKEIAAASHVPLIDLHARSQALCEELGREACYDFSPKKPEDGSNDGTHLKSNGSLLFGRVVVEELRRVVPELGALFRREPVQMPIRLAPDTDSEKP